MIYPQPSDLKYQTYVDITSVIASSGYSYGDFWGISRCWCVRFSVVNTDFYILCFLVEFQALLTAKNTKDTVNSTITTPNKAMSFHSHDAINTKYKIAFYYAKIQIKTLQTYTQSVAL
jgi:hypothetical protein